MSRENYAVSRHWRTVSERESQTTGINIAYLIAYIIIFVVPWTTELAVWAKLLVLGATLFVLATMLWIDRLIYDRMNPNRG